MKIFEMGNKRLCWEFNDKEPVFIQTIEIW